MLERIGLAELSPLLDGNVWNFDPDSIVCDQDGKAIICRNYWGDHIAETLSGLLAKEIKSVEYEVGDFHVACFTAIPKLTIPERHTVATMTRYFDTYSPGIDSNADYASIPGALHALGAPLAFQEEADAYQAAEVFARVTGFDADVATLDNGYAVILHDCSGRVTGYDLPLSSVPIESLRSFPAPGSRKHAWKLGTI